MKIYARKPDFIIRVNIKGRYETSYHINLCETTQDEVMDFVKKTIFDAKLHPIQKKVRVTNIEVREGIGKVNGKSISYSFKGLSTKETYDLLMEKIQEQCQQQEQNT